MSDETTSAGPNADEAGTPAPPPAAGEASAPGVPAEGIRRTRQLREKLLRKLPQLVYGTWTIKDNFQIDEELSNVVNLKADAFLAVVEPVAPERLR